MDLLPGKQVYCAFKISDILDLDEDQKLAKGYDKLKLPIKFIIREVAYPESERDLKQRLSQRIDLRVCLSMNEMYPDSSKVKNPHIPVIKNEEGREEPKFMIDKDMKQIQMITTAHAKKEEGSK